jgi:hypothetical protein
MSRASTPAHKPPPKSEALVAAEAAPAKAQAMPWGTQGNLKCGAPVTSLAAPA